MYDNNSSNTSNSNHSKFNHYFASDKLIIPERELSIYKHVAGLVYDEFASRIKDGSLSLDGIWGSTLVARLRDARGTRYNSKAPTPTVENGGIGEPFKPIEFSSEFVTACSTKNNSIGKVFHNVIFGKFAKNNKLDINLLMKAFDRFYSVDSIVNLICENTTKNTFFNIKNKGVIKWLTNNKSTAPKSLMSLARAYGFGTVINMGNIPNFLYKGVPLITGIKIDCVQKPVIENGSYVFENDGSLKLEETTSPKYDISVLWDIDGIRPQMLCYYYYIENNMINICYDKCVLVPVHIIANYLKEGGFVDESGEELFNHFYNIVEYANSNRAELQQDLTTPAAAEYPSNLPVAMLEAAAALQRSKEIQEGNYNQ